MSSCVGCIPIGWNVTGWREPSVRRNCWRWPNGFRTSWNGYEADPVIADRVKKGAEYFREHTMSIFGKFLEEAIPEIDNKEVRKLVEQNMERFRGEVNLKLETLKVIGNGFCKRLFTSEGEGVN